MRRVVSLVGLYLPTIRTQRALAVRVPVALVFGLTLLGSEGAPPAWMVVFWLAQAALGTRQLGAAGQVTLPALPVTPTDRRLAVLAVLLVVDLVPLLLPALAWFGPAGLVNGDLPAPRYLLFAAATVAGVLVSGLDLSSLSAARWRAAAPVGPLHAPPLPPRAALGALIADTRIRAVTVAVGSVALAYLGLGFTSMGGGLDPLAALRDVAYARPSLNLLGAPSPVGWALLGAAQVGLGLTAGSRFAALGVPLGHTLRALPIAPSDVVAAVAREAALRAAVAGGGVFVVAALGLFLAGAWHAPLEVVGPVVGVVAWTLLAAASSALLLGGGPRAQVGGILVVGVLLVFLNTVPALTSLSPAWLDPAAVVGTTTAFALLAAALLAWAARGATRRLGPG